MSKLKHSIIEMLHTFWEVFCELWIPITAITAILFITCWVCLGLLTTLCLIVIGIIAMFVFLSIVYVISTVVLYGRKDTVDSDVER